MDKREGVKGGRRNLKPHRQLRLTRRFSIIDSVASNNVAGTPLDLFAATSKAVVCDCSNRTTDMRQLIFRCAGPGAFASYRTETNSRDHFVDNVASSSDE